MEMRLRKATEGGFFTIALKGDCDMYGAPRMKNAILGLVAKGTTRLRLDFSEVAYLDSTGVGAIIQIMQAMKASAGEVVFRGIAGSPRKVLELSNVISIMRLETADGAP